MIAAGVGLALAAAALHATWNVLVKAGGDPLQTFRRATLASAVAATVALLPALAIFGRPAVSPPAVGLCLLSSVLETIYLVLLSLAYQRGELSAVYPIARGSAPLLAVAFGLIVLGERLSAPQLAGVALLVAGILAVTISQAGGRATLPALLTGLTIAAYTSVDRLGVRLTAPWFYAWLLFSLMAIELPIALAIASRFLGKAGAIESPGWRTSAVIGVFMWAGYFLVLWALSLAPLAVVAPVRETSIVAVAAWGVWRMRERRGAAVKLTGAVATLAGVALLAV
ncbi:MAG TPA: EamA family transporter [Candidatus Limnocylindrales bacterium]|nr:EamA family transporter [Candidatus Limnocylindrales bacterium]